MASADDASLVRSALAGDQSAFGELANRYRDAAFGVAFSRLGDFEAARDAAQEALVTAYLDLPTLRDPSKFGNWLYRIAGMTAMALLRRRKYSVSLEAPELAEYPGSAPDPAESAEQAEKAGQVRDALSALPETEKLAVILHYVNGYSHSEIGDILGTSVPAVKSRIHRGRSRLREEMLHMVESSLKSQTPSVEFTEELVRQVLRKHAEHGFAILDGPTPGPLEYSAETREAIAGVASELAGEGLSWLVAPPHIPDGSPALAMLKDMGFQPENELLWYEHSLQGKLPAIPRLDPQIEIRPLTDADPDEVLAFLRATMMRHAPEAIDTEHIRDTIGDATLARNASLAAYRDSSLVALISVYDNKLGECWKYEPGSAVLWWVAEHEDSTQVTEWLIAQSMKALKKAGFRTFVKNQVRRKYDPELMRMLERLGFRHIRSQWNLKLDLRKWRAAEKPA